MCVFAEIALFAAEPLPPTVALEIKLASAQLGATGHISGSSIAAGQLIGWRFQIASPLDVDHVGGHLYESDPGGLFAALVALPSIDAVPAGAPINSDELIAETVFDAPFPSTEVSIPLSAALQPGAYVLVFGTANYGATGAGAMPNFDDQPDIPPTNLSSYIFWSRPFIDQPFEWRENLASHMRFVIDARLPIPGDYNHDGAVDADDYDLWRASFGSTGNLSADGNGDSVVDVADYTIWRDNLGQTAAGAGTNVPEPASAIIMIAGAMFASMARSRRFTFVGPNEDV
jgi:hypothetical protein